MKEIKSKIIALIDWNWKGHHPTYFKLCARTMLDLGYSVIALSPNPEELLADLSNLPNPSKKKLYVEKIYGWPSCSKWIPSKFATIISGLRVFLSIRKILMKLSKKIKKYPDLIFFACIYDWDFKFFRWYGWLMPCMWSGLYLQSFGFRITTSPLYEWHRSWASPSAFLSSKKLLAIGTLDEGIVDKIEQVTGRQNCVLFPDIADDTIGEHPSLSLGQKIRNLMGARPIITLCGMLYPQRGVEIFLKTALVNPEWAFVLAGEVPYHANNTTGPMLLRRFLEELPFSYFHPMRVSDEAAYNSLISISDVVWNIHLDWPGSSNTLTKAAAFCKPVVVGDGHLLADRVRAFNTGEVCDEKSIEDISIKLHKILDNTEVWKETTTPKWEEYRIKNSKSQLQLAFESIISHIK